jgi:dolichol-phosphate mannosyltransferase
MADTLVIIPTYNEKENIERLIGGIFKHAPDVNLLIVDDNSPDTTGEIVDRIAAEDNRVSIIHRLSNRGRGLTGIQTFKETIKREGIHYVIEMEGESRT